jgi:hypothetical protein
MKTRNIGVWILIAAFLLVTLTACATAAPQPTPIPPTATSLPPTEVPEPASCDEVVGNCLEITFDGENCSYDGPVEHKIGAATVIFINQSDELAQMALIEHPDDKTVQDAMDYFGGKPGYGIPAWFETYTFHDARAGMSDTWEVNLATGDHSLICTQGLPLKKWFGGGFTVEN